MSEITKDDFEAFEEVRMSGRINMADVRTGTVFSGISRDKYIEILKNYESYMNKYDI